MDCSPYNKALTSSLVTWLAIGLVVLISACICVIYIVKNRKDDDIKLVFPFLLFLLIGVIVGTIILVGNTTTKVAYDLKNCAYIVVEGDFSVINDEKTSSRSCSLILKNGTRLETTIYTLSPGDYTGRIVYGEKTRRVLEVSLFN